jgi:hypothetical protein
MYYASPLPASRTAWLFSEDVGEKLRQAQLELQKKQLAQSPKPLPTPILKQLEKTAISIENRWLWSNY